MAADDKVQNTGEELGGKLKEGIGKLTGDDSQVEEGQADQSKANLKQAGEKIKDAFS